MQFYRERERIKANKIKKIKLPDSKCRSNKKKTLKLLDRERRSFFSIEFIWSNLVIAFLFDVSSCQFDFIRLVNFFLTQRQRNYIINVLRQNQI